MAKQASAAQRKWMSDIAEWAQDNLYILYGEEYNDWIPFELHHVLGRTAKHNKVDIGHEFIIPVPVELHNVSSNHPDNVTHFKKNFVKRFGTQRALFEEMVVIMGAQGYQKPCEAVLEAIKDTSA